MFLQWCLYRVVKNQTYSPRKCSISCKLAEELWAVLLFSTSKKIWRFLYNSFIFPILLAPVVFWKYTFIFFWGEWVYWSGYCNRLLLTRGFSEDLELHILYQN